MVIKMEEQDYTQAKRRLGTSHWDKKLVANMLELSEADNYEDAHKEWIATGDVWWRGSSNAVPQWVLDSPSEDHKCLCGHWIVYHFRIRNTENGNEAVVGSDHINSYLIIRALSQEKGISANEITEEMIQEWLNVRVKGMKAEAWWKENGASFTMMFDKVKEIDLRYNTKIKEWRYNSETQRSEPVYALRKRRDGDKMASVVWRWNHPENTRRQIDSRGYPNKDLLFDISMLFGQSLGENGLANKLAKEKESRAKLVAEVAERKRLENERREKQRAEREARIAKRRAEQRAYEEKMRPICKAERKKAEAERLERRRAELASKRDWWKLYGSNYNDSLEYYGLERIDFNLVDYLSLTQMNALGRYMASVEKHKVSGDTLRNLDGLIRQAKINKQQEKDKGEE